MIIVKHAMAGTWVIDLGNVYMHSLRLRNLLPIAIDADKAWLVHIASAMSAGATSSCMTNPLWLIKTRLMVCWDIVYELKGYRN